MKPVVVFRHALSEGAGYLGTFLEQRAIPWCEVRIDKGEAVPAVPDAYSGVVLMGGPMSVNDDLPWISPLLEFIRSAVTKDVPVLGHCLGGQLLSKALGGVVRANPVKEIGWGQVQVTPNDESQKWFGDISCFLSFHWHGETFTLPAGAVHLLSSPYCANQAYSIGKHIGFQCHIEMTPEMVALWNDNGADEVSASLSSPAVQSKAQMLDELASKCQDLHALANRVYSQWVMGLRA